MNDQAASGDEATKGQLNGHDSVVWFHKNSDLWFNFFPYTYTDGVFDLNLFKWKM